MSPGRAVGFFVALWGVTGCAGGGRSELPRTCASEGDVSIEPPEGCATKITGSRYIAAILPYSGAQSRSATTMERAVFQAVIDINGQGGVHGECVGVVVCNNETLADRAAQRMREVVALPQVMGFIPVLDEAAPNAAQIAKSFGKPAVAANVAASMARTLDDDGFFFRTVVDAGAAGAAIATAALAQSHRRVYVLNIDDEYGNSLRDGFQRALLAQRGQTDFYAYDAGAPDFERSAVDAAVSYFPTAILLAGHAEDSTAIVVEAMRRGSRVAWWLGDTGYNEEFYVGLGHPAYANGFRGSAPQRDGWEPERVFVERYQSLWNETPVDPLGPQFYDAAFLIGMAAQLSDKGASGADLRDALQYQTSRGSKVFAGEWSRLLELAGQNQTTVDYVGASGPVDFDSLGDVAGNIDLWRYSDAALVVEGCVNSEGGACVSP